MRERLDEHQEAVAHKVVTEQLWTEPLVNTYLARFPKSDGSTVLVAEARCGYIPSRWVQTLAPETRIIALDPSREMLDLARQRVEEDLQRQIFFVPQSVDAISYADGVFKGAVCMNGLVTLAQLRGGLQELARVVEPSGHLLLAVPTRDCFPEFYDLFDEALRAHGLGDVAQRFHDQRASFIGDVELYQLARELGLHGVEVNLAQWEVGFESGREALSSAIVRETFFSHWLGTIRSSDRDVVLRYVADAIDTYFHGRTFSASVQAACLLATR